MEIGYIIGIAPSVFVCTVVDDFGTLVSLPTYAETGFTSDPICMAVLFILSGEVH